MHRKIKSTNNLEHFEKDVQKIWGRGMEKTHSLGFKREWGATGVRDCRSVKKGGKAGREEGVEK